ncbi:hypothetical protein [Bifidobacterium leontopitheci]|uniref:Uncharacterized protein n=1 Tax=Bifidobacterium leontopitheci TaxID=2650774 RepID=A0A6I1GJV0_9BIFI|nr:hypothetical protein [Bifidobacterium leontopitheci]KAB7789916.1 hypothetical protein F7D09_1583 [Bifidobacterium leontopitheci]
MAFGDYKYAEDQLQSQAETNDHLDEIALLQMEANQIGRDMLNKLGVMSDLQRDSLEKLDAVNEHLEETNATLVQINEAQEAANRLLSGQLDELKQINSQLTRMENNTAIREFNKWIDGRSPRSVQYAAWEKKALAVLRSINDFNQRMKQAREEDLHNRLIAVISRTKEPQRPYHFPYPQGPAQIAPPPVWKDFDAERARWRNIRKGGATAAGIGVPLLLIPPVGFTMLIAGGATVIAACASLSSVNSAETTYNWQMGQWNAAKHMYDTQVLQWQSICENIDQTNDTNYGKFCDSVDSYRDYCNGQARAGIPEAACWAAMGAAELGQYVKELSDVIENARTTQSTPDEYPELVIPMPIPIRGITKEAPTMRLALARIREDWNRKGESNLLPPVPMPPQS